MIKTNIKSPHNFFQYSNIIFQIMGRKIYILTFIIFWSGIIDIVGISMFAPLISTITENLSSNKITVATSQFFNFLGLKLNLFNISFFISLVFMLKSILVFITRKYIYDLIEDIKADLRYKSISNISSTEYNFFSKYKSGYLTNLLTSEIEKVAATVKVFCNLMTTFCWCLIFFVAALYLAPLATIIVFLVFIFIQMIIKFLASSLRKLSLDLSKYDFNFKDIIIQFSKNFKYLKITSRLPSLLDILFLQTKNLQEVAKKINTRREFVNSILEPIGIALILYLLYFRTEVRGYPVEESIALIFFIYRVYRFGSETQSHWNNLHTTIGGLIVFFNFEKSLKLNFQSKSKTSDIDLKKYIQIIKGNLKINNQLILKNINLKIYKNQLIGIFGKSGSGKTTLVDTIFGLHDLTSGQIIIDNNVTSSDQRRSLGQKIGYVTQNPVTFNDTIFNNITLFEKNSNKNKLEVLKALKLAKCNFINEKDVTIDTIVGEGGISLSGGQIQRLAIARELYKKPNILILDEATNSLDRDTENLFLKSLMKLKAKITIIIITHQLESLKKVDNIFVVDNGTVINEGNFSKIKNFKAD